jgi:hypothetical protein
LKTGNYADLSVAAAKSLTAFCHVFWVCLSSHAVTTGLVPQLLMAAFWQPYSGAHQHKLADTTA